MAWWFFLCISVYIVFSIFRGFFKYFIFMSGVSSSPVCSIIVPALVNLSHIFIFKVTLVILL